MGENVTYVVNGSRERSRAMRCGCDADAMRSDGGRDEREKRGEPRKIRERAFIYMYTCVENLGERYPRASRWLHRESREDTGEQIQ